MKNFHLLTIFYLLFSSILLADIINVPADTSTIQGGISLANTGDIVLVADGTYYENINFKGKAITVASHYILDQDTSHISATIVDGSQRSHPDSGSVVYFMSGEDTTSVLQGFTITGGTGTVAFVGDGKFGRMGGGILILDAGAKISNNFICNNSVTDSFVVIGGGLTAGPPTSNSIVIIENNTFDSNSCIRSVRASNGGGMAIVMKARVYNNTFSNNFVSSDSGEAFGGGFIVAYNLDSVLIYNNLITNNKVETNFTTDRDLDGALGGGFVLWNDHTAFIRMTGNEIAYNEVTGSNYIDGAGGFIEDIKGDALIANNIIHDNYYNGTVSCQGTGLRMIRSKVNIINNTIADNEPSVNGGALSTYNDDSSVFMNNIIWGNSDGQTRQEIKISMGNPPIFNYCDIQGGWEGEGNMDSDPLFSDTLFHLSEYSPCIGSGVDTIRIEENNYYCPETDYEGNQKPNPVDIYIDIGALESTFPSKAFPLSTSFLEKYVPINTGTAHVNTEIFNPHNENINVSVIISSADTSAVDSTELFDDGTHEDGNAGDGLYGGNFESITEETFYTASIGINYITNDQYVVFNDNKKFFTTIGPIKLSSYQIISSDTIPNHGDRIGYKLTLRNEGQTAIATNVTTTLVSLDSCVTIVGFPDKDYGDIAPGATAIQAGGHTILLGDTLSGCSNPMTTQILVEISSNGQVFWYDTLEINFSDIEKDDLDLPKSFALHQNYPNPFNPKTIINYQLPMMNYVDLSIYNLVGQKVTTLVNKKQNAGYHQIEWDASNFASGIYYYQIRAGEFQDVKKMILLK